jgi:endoglucanase
MRLIRNHIRSRQLVAIPLLASLVGLAASAPAPAQRPAEAARAGVRLYVDPDSPAARQGRLWDSARPADAESMRWLGRRSWAHWFGDWTPDVRREAARLVHRARRSRAVPVLVAYDIPARDCGGFSAGGAGSETTYRRWIAALSRGIAGARAFVVLEPDALPGLDCLSPAGRRSRLRLLRYAVGKLVRGRTWIYLDAGHSHWQSARTMASRLRRAGMARARGFSLNVSNFDWTAAERRYARAIAARVPGARWVIDTSRNGNGPAPGYAWCNPAGRAVGRSPTTRAGSARLDAYLWVKAPGESDGTCRGGPPAGEWWPDYALGLAQRATRTSPVRSMCCHASLTPDNALSTDWSTTRYISWR